MSRCNIVKTSNVPQSFRVEKVKGAFDLDIEKVETKIDVDIDLPDEWNVGVIVGHSGTGKTTLARDAFPDFEYFTGFTWSDRAVIDDFDASLSFDEIVEALSSVGFSAPPHWLKPFDVLSNGQKMRVELARLLLENDKPVIYDEFTSVVDRQVAKIGSAAVQRFIRRRGKKFIAVSCHHDILEWLEPDWIIDMNTQTFRVIKDSLRRPRIDLEVRRTDKKLWRMFAPHHYLTAQHNDAAHAYIGYVNDEPVAWCSILHFPHGNIKNMKRVHRVVVLPDYQGIGIGHRMMSAIAEKYRRDGFRVGITTSSPAFINSLRRSKYWALTRKPSHVSKPPSRSIQRNNASTRRLTASFEYRGGFEYSPCDGNIKKT